MEAQTLPGSNSRQKAELRAPIRALEMAEGRAANTRADCRFSMVRTSGAI